jgi:hypothetical protein
MTKPRTEIVRIEELIAELDERMDTLQGLMREHLTAARSCLLGSMPVEYEMTIGLAREILPQIEPPELRTRLENFLRPQSLPRKAVMSE